MATLRLATYNLRDLLDDVDAVQRVLRALDADVVCLQEVPRHLVGDLRTWRLARAAGYRNAPTHALGGGTTVLWSHRVRDARVRHVPLRVPVLQRRRGAAVLDGVLDGLAVRAVSIHLGLHEVQRVRHATQVAALLAGAEHVVVAGDANEGQDGAAVARLGLAPLGDGPATYPADRPDQAIDVVLGRGWSAAREVEVKVPAPVLAAASDHRPRLVELCR